jgi:hypothetical protein
VPGRVEVLRSQASNVGLPRATATITTSAPRLQAIAQALYVPCQASKADLSRSSCRRRSSGLRPPGAWHPRPANWSWSLCWAYPPSVRIGVATYSEMLLDRADDSAPKASTDDANGQRLSSRLHETAPLNNRALATCRQLLRRSHLHFGRHVCTGRLGRRGAHRHEATGCGPCRPSRRIGRRASVPDRRRRKARAR